MRAQNMITGKTDGAKYALFAKFDKKFTISL